MTDEAHVQLVRGSETRDGVVRWSTDTDGWAMSVRSLDIEVSASGRDAFDALLEVRRRLEQTGWLIAVAGARVDAWPSGLLREVSGGTRVYLFENGEPAEVAGTFDPVQPAEAASVRDQMAAVGRADAVGRPPVTAQLIAEAQANPGGWVYAIDPAFSPASAVPGRGVVGGFRVDPEGNITEEYVANPDYRPTPQALGFAAPTDPVDVAVQAAVTGWGEVADVLLELRLAAVIVGPTRPNLPTPVYSAPEHARADGCTAGDEIPFGRLSMVLDGVERIQINPASSASIELDLDQFND